jgi:hypothetical protein
MKHLLMGVYQVCANKSPWVKLALQRWGDGGLGVSYIQVSDLRAIMALLLNHWLSCKTSFHKLSMKIGLSVEVHVALAET